jgi:hypothetical protein
MLLSIDWALESGMGAELVGAFAAVFAVVGATGWAVLAGWRLVRSFMEGSNGSDD